MRSSIVIGNPSTCSKQARSNSVKTRFWPPFMRPHTNRQHRQTSASQSRLGESASASSAFASLRKLRTASRTCRISRRSSLSARRSGTSDAFTGLPSSSGSRDSRSSLRVNQSSPGVPVHICLSLTDANAARVDESTLSAVLLRNATPSVFHQRHIGRLLRSSCNVRGRRLASSRGREPRPMPSSLAG